MTTKTVRTVRQRHVPTIDDEYSFSELKGARFPHLKWIVEGLLVEGLTILAARPKLGKSWMVLDIAIAAANGGKALTSIQCEDMTTLYYALEDNPRRLHKRGRILLKNQDWPERFRVRHKLSRIDQGGLDEIKDWVKKHKADLVIIDTYNKIRPVRKNNEDPYTSDYNSTALLQALATELRISIVIVHHVRKAEASDPMDLITGSTGLQAAADTMLVLTKDQNGIVLHGRGRDLDDEIEKAIVFDRSTCKWSITGPANEARVSPERREIINILRGAKDTVSPAEIAEIVGKPAGSVTKMMFDMAKDGQIRKISRGEYAL